MNRKDFLHADGGQTFSPAL